MFWILLLAFGCIGVILRYFVAIKLNSEVFPYGTLLVNLVGSFLIGYVFTNGLLAQWLGTAGRMALIVGFLGALTTFSSYSLDALMLVDRGRWLTALGYVMASNIVGFLCCFAGYRLGRLAI